jgi:hypothetical protein
LAAVVLWNYDPVISLLFVIAPGHFFLFCNVFRIRRGPELIWAGLFLVNTCLWWSFVDFGWLGVLAVQTPITAILIALEMRSPSYHGILARRINPRLDDYLRRDSDEPQPLTPAR